MHLPTPYTGMFEKHDKIIFPLIPSKSSVTTRPKPVTFVNEQTMKPQTRDRGGIMSNALTGERKQEEKKKRTDVFHAMCEPPG